MIHYRSLSNSVHLFCSLQPWSAPTRTLPVCMLTQRTNRANARVVPVHMLAWRTQRACARLVLDVQLPICTRQPENTCCRVFCAACCVAGLPTSEVRGGGHADGVQGRGKFLRPAHLPLNHIANRADPREHL